MYRMRLFGDTFGLFWAFALIVAIPVAVYWRSPTTGAADRIECLQEDVMCRYCKGTGKYQLLNKVVDCDQCDGHEVVAVPEVPRFADELDYDEEKECPVPTELR